MRSRWSPRLLLLGASLAILAVAAITRPGVPLYNGVNFPDEPYRYVKPPASQKKATPAPVPAAKTYQLSQPVYGVYMSSAEQGPQVYVYIDHSALVVPQGATEFTLSARPLAPTDQPSAGNIAGNVYDISATSDAGPLSIQATNNKTFHTVDLRLPQEYLLRATMVFKAPSGSWQAVPTTKVGTDIYEATLNGFGQYALIIPNTKVVMPAQHKSPPFLLIALSSGVVIAMTGVIVGIRRAENKKRRAKTPTKKSGSKRAPHTSA